MNEITERELIKNDLLVSGYTFREVAKLTKHLNTPDGHITSESMCRDLELDVARSLGMGWLVRHLMALAEGDNPVVAVAALEQLVKISIQTGVLLKPDLVFNNLS